MKLWEEVKAVFTKDNLDEVKNFFMVNRFLSFHKDSFIASAMLNRYNGKVPSWAMTHLYRFCMPTSPSPYITYKNKKPKRKDPELIKRISRHLNCNETCAVEVMTMMRNRGENPERYFGLKKGE